MTLQRSNVVIDHESVLRREFLLLATLILANSSGVLELT